MDVNAIDFDSRNITKNDVFVAIKGLVSDGHEFIDTAIEKGAIAIVCETLPENLQNGITYIEVESASKALAFMASNYYRTPSENLKTCWCYWNQWKNNCCYFIISVI